MFTACTCATCSVRSAEQPYLAHMRCPRTTETSSNNSFSFVRCSKWHSVRSRAMMSCRGGSGFVERNFRLNQLLKASENAAEASVQAQGLGRPRRLPLADRSVHGEAHKRWRGRYEHSCKDGAFRLAERQATLLLCPGRVSHRTSFSRGTSG
jgi:hypothetical protein